MPAGPLRVAVIGAGVAGLACALELAERGARVQLFERAAGLKGAGCSWFAGGMLAPWCERENAEELIATLGAPGLQWWGRRVPSTARRGTLVIAQPRDTLELTRFARRTSHWQWLDGTGLQQLEPELGVRFDRALFFAEEGHLEPRAALAALREHVLASGVELQFGVDAHSVTIDADVRVDCRGLAARDVLTDLRGVKGEMLLVHSNDIHLSRPVRILHPRIPMYIVPRGAGLYMIGATSIESEDAARVTARSVIELLNGACVVHPAFGEAHVVELGTHVRPAFDDNLPQLRWHERTLYVNGLYRHGYLLAPALAQMAAEAVLNDRRYPEVMDAHHRQRRCS
jgi:glycine oxidase